MQRGIITISKAEALEALNTIPETQKQTPLFSKLTSTQAQDTEEIELLLSEEEAENILDNLGLPIPEESDALKSMRKKVQEYLMNLRKKPIV